MGFHVSLDESMASKLLLFVCTHWSVWAPLLKYSLHCPKIIMNASRKLARAIIAMVLEEHTRLFAGHNLV